MNHYRTTIDGVMYTLPNKNLAAKFDDCLEAGLEADLDWAEKYLTLPDPAIKLSKKELNKQKVKLTYQISNIRADYATVSREDIPDEVTDELKVLMAELKDVKEKLLVG